MACHTPCKAAKDLGITIKGRAGLLGGVCVCGAEASRQPRTGLEVKLAAESVRVGWLTVLE